MLPVSVSQLLFHVIFPEFWGTKKHTSSLVSVFTQSDLVSGSEEAHLANDNVLHVSDVSVLFVSSGRQIWDQVWFALGGGRESSISPRGQHLCFSIFRNTDVVVFRPLVVLFSIWCSRWFPAVLLTNRSLWNTNVRFPVYSAPPSRTEMIQELLRKASKHGHSGLFILKLGVKAKLFGGVKET